MKKPFNPFNSRTSYTIVMQLSVSFSWLTLSKALLKSSRIQTVCFLLQTDLKRSSSSMESWDAQERFSLKPCWSSQKRYLAQIGVFFIEDELWDLGFYKQIQVRDMGLQLAGLKRSTFSQTTATLASSHIGGKFSESNDFWKRLLVTVWSEGFI